MDELEYVAKFIGGVVIVAVLVFGVLIGIKFVGQKIDKENFGKYSLRSINFL